MLRANVGIAEIMQKDLESFGIPPASIVPFSHRAENTRDEAQMLAGLITQRGWKRILIVTSNYHTRRARFIFERLVPTGVSVRVSGAHDLEFDASRWWETRADRNSFSTNYLAVCRRQMGVAAQSHAARVPAPRYWKYASSRTDLNGFHM